METSVPSIKVVSRKFELFESFLSKLKEIGYNVESAVESIVLPTNPDQYCITSPTDEISDIIDDIDGTLSISEKKYAKDILNSIVVHKKENFTFPDYEFDLLYPLDFENAVYEFKLRLNKVNSIIDSYSPVMFDADKIKEKLIEYVESHVYDDRYAIMIDVDNIEVDRTNKVIHVNKHNLHNTPFYNTTKISISFTEFIDYLL